MLFAQIGQKASQASFFVNMVVTTDLKCGFKIVFFCRNEDSLAFEEPCNSLELALTH